MTEEEYIKERVDDQISWYSRKSAINKKCHLWTKGLVIVFSTSILLAVGFISEHRPWLNGVIAILGALIAIFAGISTLSKYQEKWNEYRITSEALKHEKYSFKTRSGAYDSISEPFKIFVSRAENLISKENAVWSQHINKKD